jgi:hypothetical protein
MKASDLNSAYAPSGSMESPAQHSTVPSRRRLEFDPDQVFRWHCLAILGLSLGHLAVSWVHLEAGHDHLLGLTPRLQLFTEASIPAFFSAVMLVVAAGIAAVLAQVEGGRAARDGRAWIFITGLLLFMAVDEASAIHEIVNQLGQRRAEDGLRYYLWVVPFGGVALACIAILLPFWWRLPASTKWWLAAAAALFIGCAIGLELIEASLVAAAGEEAAFLRWDVIAAVTAEEGGEMLAVAMSIRALLHHLAMQQGHDGRVQVELG